MRLGRLAAAGLIAGAMVAFAAALLIPRRRLELDLVPASPEPSGSEPRRARHVDLTETERVTQAARDEP